MRIPLPITLMICLTARSAFGFSTNPTESVVQEALRLVGTPYRWGITDCSSLSQRCYFKAGLRIPRTAGEQFSKGAPVRRIRELRPADLVFWKNSKGRIIHVGVYIGSGGLVVHNSKRWGRAVIEPLHTINRRSRYAGARRILPRKSARFPSNAECSVYRRDAFAELSLEEFERQSHANLKTEERSVLRILDLARGHAPRRGSKWR